MLAEKSVSRWIALARRGDEAAAGHLWRAYFQKLLGFARKKLSGGRRRAADEEDVALSAMNSFLRRAAEGEFPQLANRDDLWRLLLTIASRKALRQRQHEARKKRGGGAVRGESALGQGKRSGRLRLEDIVAQEPTAEFAALLKEELELLLDRLGKPELQEIALLKMQGYDNGEIARQTRCPLRSVERRLHGIRALWRQVEKA
jgi:DNA-directed RNA polymerase specialized sigma24 family protein